jgi:zinc protease
MYCRKISILVILIKLMFMPLSLSDLHGQATDWRQVPLPRPASFRPLLPKRVQLSNGLVIFLLENHELPLIHGAVLMRGGTRDEPIGKAGLLQLYTQSWRTGGSKQRGGDELDDYLEARGAKVELAYDTENTTLSWNCLKETCDQVLKIVLNLLQEPAFPESKLDLSKNQLDASIARRNDNPFQIASREVRKIVYGSRSPYGRLPEYDTVASVTRDDLIHWHGYWVHPNNIIFGLVGDFDSDLMESELRRDLTFWYPGLAPEKTVIEFHHPTPGIYFIEKDDVSATTIQMVDLGISRSNPDYYPIDVFNQCFGGGFSSRLFSNIRSQKALAYSVGGAVGSDFDHPGVLRLFMATKNGNAAIAIDSLNEELKGLESNPISDQEVAQAKLAILRSLLFAVDSREKVLWQAMTYEFYQYPPGFFEQYRDHIERVTQDDVTRVARKYIQKRQFAILVIGRGGEFDRLRSAFGPVVRLDISIPKGGSRTVGSLDLRPHFSTSTR